MEEEKQKNRTPKNLEKPYFTFVWAEDEQGLIGSEGGLPWHLPNEMKHFVEVTNGGVVVMGRKTYESIPNPPLKNRINIILTRNSDFKADDVIVCHSKDDVLDYVADIQKPIHVIGGTSLFQMFIDEVNVLYRTIVYETFIGDTYMPPIDYRYFRIVDSTHGKVDAKNKYPHQFFTYIRKDIKTPF